MPQKDEKILDVIEQMKLARIGQYDTWKEIEDRIRKKQEMTDAHRSYYVSMTRIYRSARVTPRSRIVHTKLSKDDPRPPCSECAADSDYYCNVADEYYCTEHVMGHDDGRL